MGDILGVGLTHYPSFIAPDEDRMFPLTRTLKMNDRIPPALKQPSSWPEPMRREYGDDQGIAAARRHRERLVSGFRKLRQSPWRGALIASSSWSHAFLTAKHHWLWPDMESDRARFEELRDGNYAAWRQVTVSQIEAAGQQELLNWMCLAGAMEALDRKPEIVDYVETYVFNSDKCLALFKP